MWVLARCVELVRSQLSPTIHLCPLHTLGGWVGGVILPHKDTQGWCRHRPGSTFSLLVSSAPRAPQGAPAPTPYATGWGGPGALGRPLSPLHPNPISRVVVVAAGGGRATVRAPQMGDFHRKSRLWRRGRQRGRRSDLGFGAGGWRNPTTCTRVRAGGPRAGAGGHRQ